MKTSKSKRISKRVSRNVTNKKSIRRTKNIGIIVGIDADDCVNYKLYPQLKDMPKDIKALSLSYEGLPASDVSIAYNLQKKYPKYKTSILTIDDIFDNKANEDGLRFKDYDLLIGLYEATKVNLSQGNEVYKKYINIIKSSGVNFYPRIDFIDFASNKYKWIRHLKKHDIPVLDTIVFDDDKSKKYINNILKKIKKKGWGEFITKPSLSAYSHGFKIWKPETTEKQFLKYIDYNFLTDIGSKILAQRYVKEFHEFYEIRTYWINNKYKCSIGTIIHHETKNYTGRGDIDYDYPKNEGGEIETELMNKLKALGKKILKIIPFDTSLIVRIDFGCCLDNRKNCREYFVNEIEYMPNLFCNEFKFPIIDEMSKNIVRLLNLKK